MDGVMEVITGRERRRRWSAAEKLRIVAETREPGAGISTMTARHGVCESLGTRVTACRPRDMEIPYHDARCLPV